MHTSIFVYLSAYFVDKTWWGVALDKTPPGGAYRIDVESAGVKLGLVDVTFGDVWMCVGENNIDLQVSKVTHMHDNSLRHDNKY